MKVINNNIKKRIDVHGHYFPPAYVKLLEKYNMTLLDGVQAPVWNLEKQWEYMEKLHISCTTLSLSSPHLHMGDKVEAAETARACNEYGAQLQRLHPDRFLPLASLPLPEVEESIQEIRYCRDKLGIHGFAFLTNFLGVYLGSPALDPVMEELNKEKTVITIHPTTPSAACSGGADELPAPVMEYFFETTRAVTNMLLKGVIRRYQNLRFIVPHGGAFLTVLSDRLQPLAEVLLPENDLDIRGDLSKLYYDLAGFSMPKQYGLLREITDETHLLYGSDSPFTFLPVCIKQAEAMDQKLTDDMAEKIYLNNPKNLFREFNDR